MQHKTYKLFALAALSAAAAFNVNAAINYEPFVGIDVGTNLTGQVRSKINGPGVHTQEHIDLKTSTVFGLKGGVTLNQAHQFSIGYDYRELGMKNGYGENADVNTFYTQYDYLVPITQKLAWTVGGKFGYETHSGFEDANELNGVVLGAQTGLNYRFNDWSIGTEVSYLTHLAETESLAPGGRIKYSYKIGNETFLTANVKYHF